MLRFGIDKNPSDIQKDLSFKHRIIRKQAGLSQSELANRSGVSLGSIKRFENSGQISLESLLKLAHILNRIQDFELIFKPTENLKEIEKLFSEKTRG